MDAESVSRDKGSGQVIRCGTSAAFLNKDNLTGKQSAFGYSFTPDALFPRSFVRHTLDGKAFTVGYFQGNTRKNDTFISSELIVLDYDNNVSVSGLRNNPIVQQYPPLLIYSTPSSTPECYRTRAVWRLSDPVEGVERYRAIARAWAEYLGLDVDPASWKPAQPYFGSTNRIEQPVINLDALLPTAFVGALTADHATDDYLRATTRQTHASVDANSPRAEKYAATAVNGAVDDYLGVPAGAKLRHNAFVKLVARLIGMKLGGWPCLENIESTIRDVGRSTDRDEREIEDAIQWAYKTVDAIPLELPDDNAEGASGNPSPNAHATYYPNGVPNGLRSALLDNQAFPDGLALLSELLNRAQQQGILPPQCTTRQLLEANVSTGVCMAPATLYRMLAAAEGVFFSKLHSKKDPSAEDLLCKTEKNPGRPEHVYRLFDTGTVERNVYAWKAPRDIEATCPVDEMLNEETSILAVPTTAVLEAVGQGEADTVAKRLIALAGEATEKGRRRAVYVQRRLRVKLQDRHSTPLPHDWPLNNLVNYRTAYLRGVVEENPGGHVSNREIARLLGISVRAVHDYRRRAGLEAEPQDKPPVPVKSFDEVRAYAKSNNAFNYKLKAVTPDGEILRSEVDRSKFPTFIADQRAGGNEVLAEFGYPNNHRIVSDKPIEHHAPRREKPRPGREPKSSQPIERYYGIRHKPAWASRQIRLLFQKLTGQSPPSDPLECIELLLGWDDFNDLAAELGAVSDVSERSQRPPGAGWQEVPLRKPSGEGERWAV